MVFVRVSETYDLSTKVNKMGIVGIHTPNNDLINRQWHGLFVNYGKFRLASCDVTLACASILPADPLQIGVEAGSIAPQDMFNPILYKAVSNDSMNSFLQFLYGYDINGGQGVVALDKGSIIDVHNTDFTGTDNANLDQFAMYYGILSNSDGWKKAMPQAGLQMKGLYPLVFERLSNVGYTGIDTGDSGVVPTINDAGNKPIIGTYARSIRGNAKRMPAVPTTYFVSKPSDSNIDGKFSHTMDADKLPPCYVGLIILPPAKLNQLYYRLKVTWTVEFSDLRAISDITSWSGMSYIGDAAYGTDYTAQSAKMSATTAMVDTDGADIQKIMEGSS